MYFQHFLPCLFEIRRKLRYENLESCECNPSILKIWFPSPFSPIPLFFLLSARWNATYVLPRKVVIRALASSCHLMYAPLLFILTSILSRVFGSKSLAIVYTEASMQATENQSHSKCLSIPYSTIQSIFSLCRSMRYTRQNVPTHLLPPRGEGVMVFHKKSR